MVRVFVCCVVLPPLSPFLAPSLHPPPFPPSNLPLYQVPETRAEAAFTLFKNHITGKHL